MFQISSLTIIRFHQLVVLNSGARYITYFSLTIPTDEMMDDPMDTVLDSMDAWDRNEVVPLNNAAYDVLKEDFFPGPEDYVTHIDTWIDHVEVAG